MSCTMLNFEALRWITLGNGVGNLSALNLNGMSFKGTFFAFCLFPSLNVLKLILLRQNCQVEL